MVAVLAEVGEEHLPQRGRLEAGRQQAELAEDLGDALPAGRLVMREARLPAQCVFRAAALDEKPDLRADRGDQADRRGEAEQERCHRSPSSTTSPAFIWRVVPGVPL